MAATPKLKAQIAMDDTKFQRTLRRVKTGAVATGATIGGAFKGAAAGVASFAAALAPVAAIMAPIVAIVGTFRGLKGALDLGGELSDLEARTGIAAGELRVLQRAFQDSGVSGDKVGQTLNKFQKSINDLGNGLSTQKRAFDALGLSFNDLQKLTPEDQFKEVQQRIASLEDPTKRAGVAMDIFGRSGAELLTLFSDAGALDRAADSIGNQADILAENAALFDRISDNLKGTGDTLRGFFVGLASGVAPQLIELLERVRTLDLSRIGQAVGNAISVFIEAFQQGRLGELVALSLKVGFGNAINFFKAKMVEAVAAISDAIKATLKLDFDEARGFLADLITDDLEESRKKLDDLVQEMLKKAQEEVPETPPPALDLSGARAAGKETGKAFADGVKEGMSDEDAALQRRAEAKAAAQFLGRRSGVDALRILQLKEGPSVRGAGGDPTSLIPEAGLVSGFGRPIPSRLANILDPYGLGYLQTGSRQTAQLQSLGMPDRYRDLQNTELKVKPDPAIRESANILADINNKLDG